MMVFIEWFLYLVLLLRPSLDWFENASIGAGALRFNPASLTAVLLIVIGVICVLNLEARQRKSLFQSTLVKAFCVWLAALLLWAVVPVILHGGSRLSGVREWIRQASYLPLVMLTLHFTRKGKRQQIINVLLLSFLLPALVAGYETLFSQGDLIKNVRRVSGTFVHPNPFAFYLILIAALAYGQIRTKEKKALSIALMLAAVLLLVSTFSFTGAVMFGVAAFACVMSEGKKIRIAAVALFLLFVLLFAITPTGWQRIRDEMRIENLDMIERTGKKTSSFTWRLVNWRFLYRQWKESPIAGHGLASSPRVNPMLGPDKIGSDPHNDYVRYLVETGIIGLAFFLFLLAMVGRALLRSLRNARDPASSRFVWCALALYAAWLVGSLADNLITATAYQYCLWAVFAVACSMEITNDEPDYPHHPPL